MQTAESAIWLSDRDHRPDPRKATKRPFESAAYRYIVKHDAIFCSKLRAVIVDALGANLAHESDRSRSEYGLWSIPLTPTMPKGFHGVRRQEDATVGGIHTPAMSHLSAGIWNV